MQWETFAAWIFATANGMAADPRAFYIACAVSFALALVCGAMAVRNRALASRLASKSSPDQVLHQSLVTARAYRQRLGRPLAGAPQKEPETAGDATPVRRNPLAPPVAPLHVKIYVDCSNLLLDWARLDKGGVDWDMLPRVVLEAVAARPEFKDNVIVYRGCNVYGSYFGEDYYDLLEKIEDGSAKSITMPFQEFKKGKIMDEIAGAKGAPVDAELKQKASVRVKQEISVWRGENAASRALLVSELNRKFGYSTFPLLRRTPQRLRSAQYTSDGVPIAEEKRVDTSFCTELIADGAYDIYDVAVVVSCDEDFVPPIEFVVKELGKHVIQLGHKTFSHAIRDCSSGYLDLQDVVASTLRAKGAA